MKIKYMIIKKLYLLLLCISLPAFSMQHTPDPMELVKYTPLSGMFKKIGLLLEWAKNSDGLYDYQSLNEEKGKLSMDQAELLEKIYDVHTHSKSPAPINSDDFKKYFEPLDINLQKKLKLYIKKLPEKEDL